MKIQPLTLQQAEFIAHRLAVELMNYENEPMPAFNTRHLGVLESCLAQPFQTFDGKYLHKTFARRVAVLFYLVTKNHGFDNGNKRMAVALTGAFFYINKRWMDVSPEALYNVACKVAESKSSEMESWISELEVFFKNHTTELPRL